MTSRAVRIHPLLPKAFPAVCIWEALHRWDMLKQSETAFAKNTATDFGLLTMIGARLGSWIIDQELGRGGMGEVYLAHRAEPGAGADRAAVKVLAAALAQDPGFKLRFQREIDAL